MFSLSLSLSILYTGFSFRVSAVSYSTLWRSFSFSDDLQWEGWAVMGWSRSIHSPTILYDLVFLLFVSSSVWNISNWCELRPLARSGLPFVLFFFLLSPLEHRVILISAVEFTDPHSNIFLLIIFMRVPFLFHDQFSWVVWDSGVAEMTCFEMSEEDDTEERGMRGWGDEGTRRCYFYCWCTSHGDLVLLFYSAIQSQSMCLKWTPECDSNRCVRRSGTCGMNGTAGNPERFESLPPTCPPAKLQSECLNDIIVW